MPTHKTAHLQIAQADTQPKFAKELFSCQRMDKKTDNKSKFDELTIKI